jgi:hypothetical protein
MTTAAQALVEIEPMRTPTKANAPAAVSVADMTPVQMAYQLIQSGADFNSVKEMLALSKELAADTAKRAFDEAVAAAKSEIPTIAKNSKGHNDKRYANFAAYAAVVDPILGTHGLNYRFRTEQSDKITVTCVLSHKGGHSEENRLSGPADSSGSKNAIQAIGSTLTYLQRYTLIQALGLAASEDDDGKAAGGVDDGGPITEEQAEAIRKLADDDGADLSRFCAYFKIEAVPDLPASQFDRAIKSLEKKRSAA